MKIKIANFRGSYVFVTKQRKNSKTGADDGWGIQVLMPKDHPQIKEFQKAVSKTLKGTFGEDAKVPKPGMAGKYKCPLRDGDVEKEGEKQYEGMYFFNANANRKPGLVDKKAKMVMSEEEANELFYSGAWFNGSFNVFTFDVDGSKGVGVGLNNLMFAKHDDRLDGSVSADQDLAEFAMDDGNDDDEFDF